MSQYGADEVRLMTQDGTELVGDLFRCSTDAAPTILRRTPYERWPAPAGGSLDHERLLGAGYHVLVQSVRGRHGSGGAFEPYVAERDDGGDTLEWITSQEWSNGLVAMVGRSYDAAAQWLVAQDAPESLKVLVPQFGAAEFGEGWTWFGGARQLGFLVDWLLGDFVRYPDRVPDLSDGIRDTQDPHALVQKVLAALALECPWVLTWWNEHPDSEYWLARAARLAGVRAACLHVGGWYDIFCSGTLRAHEVLLDRSNAGQPVGVQRLIVGPWSHDNQTGRFGPRDFGPDAGIVAWDLTREVLNFFEEHLRDTPVQTNGQKSAGTPDLVFDLGANRWREIWQWASKGTDVVVPFNVVGAHGVGPVTPSDRQLRARPLAMTGGGNHAMVGIHSAPAGPVGVGARGEAELLSFATPALGKRITLSGPLVAELWVGNTDRIADVAVELLVHRGSASDLIGSGIRRCEFPSLPLGPHHVRVDLGATLTTLNSGDVLELTVAGSSYPRFDPSPTITTSLLRVGSAQLVARAW